MSFLGDQLALLLAVVGTAGILAILHVAAGVIRNEAYVHDLRVRVAQLRKERLEKLRIAQEYERMNRTKESAPARKAA